MNEKDRDRLLRIRTTNLSEQPNQSIHYSHYEATRYSILDKLFDAYELTKSDEFVDFGCGKGRIMFYVHNRFGTAVKGVEMNEKIFRVALENQKNYMRKVKKKSEPIHIECCLAEEYDVKVTENKFYFFNPFSIQIFSKTVNNILDSVDLLKREVDIILYYPNHEYIEYLETYTPFELVQEVQVPGLYNINKNERFVIFRIEE